MWAPWVAWSCKVLARLSCPDFFCRCWVEPTTRVSMSSAFGRHWHSPDITSSFSERVQIQGASDSHNPRCTMSFRKHTLKYGPSTLQDYVGCPTSVHAFKLQLVWRIRGGNPEPAWLWGSTPLFALTGLGVQGSIVICFHKALNPEHLLLFESICIYIYINLHISYL